MADASVQQPCRGRSKRGRGGRRPHQAGSQHDRRQYQGRGRPLPVQRRHAPFPYPDNVDEHYWTNPSSYREPPTHHQDRNAPRPWWRPITKDRLPHTFQPQLCHLCDSFPLDPWAMVRHLNSREHSNRLVPPTKGNKNNRDVEKEIICEICRTGHTRGNFFNHFRSIAHRNTLKALKNDLAAAGFSVPPEDSRRERRPSGASNRSLSTEERLPESRHQPDNHSRSEASSSNHERIPSRNDDRKTEDDKSSQKHKFFDSSEEDHLPERSDDENLDIAFEKGKTSAPGSSGDPKPKMPLIQAKSLVDKRKAIISKLSNCTDVRDLTKQLRQISGGRSQEKSTRKALPGIPYSDREIEQQETFGEARAQRVQTEVENLEVGDDSDAPPVVKTEARTPTGASRDASSDGVAPEECAIVPTPARPPPEVISDTDTDDQLSSTPQRRPPTIETPVDPQNSQILPNDFAKLAAIVAQERALAEKLRYLGQTLPCIESLLSQMKQEHQNGLVQIELLRTARNRIITGITRDLAAPQGAEIFSPNLIMGALLRPPVHGGFSNISWAAPSCNGNLSTLLQSLGLPESTASPIISSSGLPNGTCSSALGVCDSASNSYAEAPASTSLNSSIRGPTPPVTSSRANDRKRPPSRDTLSSESKRGKSCEFDEQLHSEIILVVKLSGNYVYTSSKDGIVKRTPLQDGAGSVVLYKHSAEDSNSKLSKVWAFMLEVSVHKKLVNSKVITGSNDCAIRIFDGASGHLMKVVPVQARVQCGVVHWQKIYVGLKSGYIQVYNLADQRYIVESQHKQVPKFMAANEILNSKSIVVVTEDNSVLIRDAGTLFVLHAIERLEQEVKALMVKDDHILLCGRDRLFVFDKNAELSLKVDLSSNVSCAVPMKSGALLATTDGTLRSCKWKGIFLGNENVQNETAFTRDSRTVVTSIDGSDATSSVAVATDSGRVIVVKLTSRSC